MFPVVACGLSRRRLTPVSDEEHREQSVDEIPEVPKRQCAVDGCENDSSRSINAWAQNPAAMKASENLKWANIPLCADHLAQRDRHGDKVFAARYRLKRA